MNFYFFTNVTYEDWNYNTPNTTGIGGSETSIIEMSSRLALRNHNVTVYAPIPKETKPRWKNTTWKYYKEADFSQKGTWILYRCPEIIDKFPQIGERKDQVLYLVSQDWGYPNFTSKRIKNLNYFITLSNAHTKYIVEKHKQLKPDQIFISSNGIKVELLKEIEKKKIKRNPLRIMHASSPDRGLKQAILIFKKAKEFIPELELHAFYGFDNLDKLITTLPNSNPIVKNTAEIKELLKTTEGITFHGRIPQPELYREWFKSGIYLYITDFFETSNIASMEAQSMGAVPVFSPVFAQGENIQHGIGIEGKSDDPLTLSRAAAEVVRLAQHPELQEVIRKQMMPWARQEFTWEKFVDQWEEKMC